MRGERDLAGPGLQGRAYRRDASPRPEPSDAGGSGRGGARPGHRQTALDPYHRPARSSAASGEAATNLTDGLRRVAAAALQRYEFGEHRLVPLTESFNAVFRVDCAAGSFLVRVGPGLRIHPVDAVRGEARWTRQLAGRGLLVPQLVRASDGAVSVRVTADDPPNARECSVWTWVPGDPLTAPTVDAPSTDADLRQLAELSAQLHDASPPLTERPPDVLSARSVHYFDLPDRLPDLPLPHRAVLLAARDQAQQAIDVLWRTADTAPRIVHGDLTPSNVVRYHGALAAIDCQDLSWAHVQQDLAHTIYGITRGVDLAAGLAAFRAGYERVRPWPGLDLGLLTDLVMARRVAMVNLAIARRRPGLAAYVERHAEALRPLLGRVDR